MRYRPLGGRQKTTKMVGPAQQGGEKYTTFGAILYIYKFKVNKQTRNRRKKNESGEESQAASRTGAVKRESAGAILVVSPFAGRNTGESETLTARERERETANGTAIFFYVTKTRSKRRKVRN